MGPRLEAVSTLVTGVDAIVSLAKRRRFSELQIDLITWCRGSWPFSSTGASLRREDVAIRWLDCFLIGVS